MHTVQIEAVIDGMSVPVDSATEAEIRLALAEWFPDTFGDLAELGDLAEHFHIAQEGL